MTEQSKMGSRSEQEELKYSFTASVGYSAQVDLIADGWVDSLEEWEGLSTARREDILNRILFRFAEDSVELYWEKAQ